MGDPGEEKAVFWENTKGHHGGIYAPWDPDRVHTSSDEFQTIGQDGIHRQSILGYQL